MTTIIRPDFSTGDFDKLVHDFSIVKGKQITPSSLETIERFRKNITTMFQPYFQIEGNLKYDRLIGKMAYMAKKLKEIIPNLPTKDQKTMLEFLIHWCNLMEKDYKELNESYLKNSCNYMIWEIEQLAA